MQKKKLPFDIKKNKINLLLFIIFIITPILSSCQSNTNNTQIYSTATANSEPSQFPNNPQYLSASTANITGTIVYQSSIGNDVNISIVTLPDGHSVQITNGNNDIEPSWSPDGKQIVYACKQSSHHEICTMDSDGSNKSQLTDSPADKWGPVWSPDGKQIAFVSNEVPYSHIYIIDLSTKQIHRFLPSAKGNDSAPSYSPDGQWIAFTSDRNGFNLYKAHPDGSGEVQITFSKLDDRPKWSPDGKTIVFRRLAKNSSFFNGNEIFIVGSDGKNAKELTDNNVGDDWPSFSSDGKWIVFSEEENGQNKLMIMSLSDNGPSQIYSTGIIGTAPEWQP